MISNGVDWNVDHNSGKYGRSADFPENLRIPVVTIEENSGVIQGDCVQTSCTQELMRLRSI